MAERFNSSHVRAAALRYFVDENSYVQENDLRDIAKDIVLRAISNLSQQMGTLELAHRRGALPWDEMDDETKALMQLVGKGRG